MAPDAPSAPPRDPPVESAAGATAGTARGHARRPHVPAPLAWLLAATLVLSLAWALVTPAFQAPDENSHFGYVQSLAEGPGLPGAGDRPTFSTEQGLAAASSNADQAAAQSFVKLEWSRIAYERWRREEAALPARARSDGGGPNPASSNPPLYYLYEAAAYDAAMGGDIFDRLLALRVASLLWLLVTVSAVWLLAGEVFGRDRLLQLAAASVAGLAPMLTFVSASVTPDAMMFALWSLALWLGVRVVKRGIAWPESFVLFLIVGAACCVKATSYALFPPAVLALAIGLLRRRPWRPLPTLAAVAAAPLAVAATLGVWKLVATGAERATSAQLTAVTSTDGGVNIRWFLSYLWQFYFPMLPGQVDFAFPYSKALPVEYIWLKGSWGAFGWLEVTYPTVIRGGLVAVTAIAVAAAATTIWRTRRATDWAVAAFLVLAVLSLLLGLHWTEFQQLKAGGRPLNQGRYLLPLVGVAGLVAAQAVGVFSARRRVWVVVVVMCGLLALQLTGLGLMLERFYA